MSLYYTFSSTNQRKTKIKQTKIYMLKIKVQGYPQVAIVGDVRKWMTR